MQTARSLILMAVLAASGGFAATTYYVATNGNDSAAGTLEAPLLTIAAAVGKTVNGDTVQLTAGTYVLSGPVAVSLAITVKGAAEDRRAVVVDGGGAVRCFAFANDKKGTFLFTHSRFFNNWARYDGGAFRGTDKDFDCPTSEIRNCLMVGNDGNSVGAAVLFSNTVMTACTVVSNFVRSANYPGGVTIRNTSRRTLCSTTRGCSASGPARRASTPGRMRPGWRRRSTWPERGASAGRGWTSAPTSGITRWGR